VVNPLIVPGRDWAEHRLAGRWARRHPGRVSAMARVVRLSGPVRPHRPRCPPSPLLLY